MAADEFGVPRDPHGVLNAARRTRHIKVVAFGASGLGATAIAALSGAPWWIVGILITVAVVGVLAAAFCVLVEMVFPQESADRLEWWRDYRRVQRGRRSWERRAVPVPIVERDQAE